MNAVTLAMTGVEMEVRSAAFKHPKFHSAHEGYAVLLEEMDELWFEVMRHPDKRDVNAMRNEARQVAARQF